MYSCFAGGTSKAIQNRDTERYAAFSAENFTFLRPDKVTDANRRRPDHPDYDPSTLYIARDWFKANKISEGQQQWQVLLLTLALMPSHHCLATVTISSNQYMQAVFVSGPCAFKSSTIC